MYSPPNIITLESAKEKKYYIALDTETTGLFDEKHQENPIKHYKHAPRLVSVGLAVYRNGEIIDKYYNIVKISVQIPEAAIKIHKITNEMCLQGVIINQVLYDVLNFLDKYRDGVIIGHNVKYDYDILITELHRHHINSRLPRLKYYDTCAKINERRYSLAGLYKLCFSEDITVQHNAYEDAVLCLKCFVHLCLKE